MEDVASTGQQAVLDYLPLRIEYHSGVGGVIFHLLDINSKCCVHLNDIIFMRINAKLATNLFIRYKISSKRSIVGFVLHRSGMISQRLA